MPKKQKNRVILPGVSYIPDPMVLSERENLQRKLSFEFIDFLECLYDLLYLLQAIKVKHLQTIYPIPFEVIREIRSESRSGIKHRTYLKAFEKNLKSSSAGISHSLQCLLSTASSHSTTPRRYNTTLKKNSNPVKTEHQEVIHTLGGGRTPKPLWHRLAREKFVTVAMMEEEQMKEKKVQMKAMMKDSKLSARRSSNVNPNIRQPKKDTFSIKFATSSRSNNKPSDDQKALMVAYEAGFTSAEAHKNFEKTLEPFWYTNLIKDSKRFGLKQSEELTESFHMLAQFFDVNCQSIPQPRAKLCIILHSLPIWDVMRMCMQRAAEYILRYIFLVPSPEAQLEEWLFARRIPYVVVLPKLEKHDSDDNE